MIMMIITIIDDDDDDDDGGDNIYVANFLGFRRVLYIKKKKNASFQFMYFRSPEQSQKVRWFWYRVFTFAVPYPVIL